jgi:hypothetical protein
MGKGLSAILNSTKVMPEFINSVSGCYYIDKSMMIENMLMRIIPYTVFTSNKYVCVTRPRGFGKTHMLSMLGTFFAKGHDTAGLFNNLKIASSPLFEEHVNKHNVIHVNFSLLANQCNSCHEIIQEACGAIIDDLIKAWPDMKLAPTSCDYRGKLAGRTKTSLKSAEVSQEMGKRLIYTLNRIFDIYHQSFIFLFDEWDAPLRMESMDAYNKVLYLDFLRCLLKGAQYAELAYMTGILPVMGYSNYSSLNMFWNYKTGDDPLFSEFFGFTKAEVKELHARYASKLEGERKRVGLKALKYWFDGYKTDIGRIYNPASVMDSLANNKISMHWTGKAAELMDCLSLDFDSVKDDVKTLALEQMPVYLENLVYNMDGASTRDEVLSMLVAVGLLAHHNGKASIPNREVAKEYEKALEDPRFGHVSKLVLKSKEIVGATLGMDANKVAELIDAALLDAVAFHVYRSDSELMHVISSAYMNARKSCEAQSDLPKQAGGAPTHLGKGYCGLILTPIKKKGAAFAVGLNSDATAEAALTQLKSNIQRSDFQADSSYIDRMLLVGIGYDKVGKVHKCVIEKALR